MLAPLCVTRISIIMLDVLKNPEIVNYIVLATCIAIITSQHRLHLVMYKN